MPKAISAVFSVVLAVAAFAPFALRAPAGPTSWAFEAPPAPVFESGQAPEMSVKFLAESFPTTMSHAPSAAEAANGDLLVVWYGGSREGGPDVGIYLSRSADAGATWSSPRLIVDRQLSQRASGLYVKGLGNPSILRDASGGLWLFYVATVGGWSTAWVEFVRSEDGGRTWSSPRRLYTAPGWNYSTLVRAPPLLYRDGRIGLPAYHEGFRKLSELVVLDGNGVVVDKVRISKGRRSIQPSIVVFDDFRAVAFMRPVDSPLEVLKATTENGGRSWSTTKSTDLVSPNAANMGLRLDGETVLLAYNDHPSWRANMALALSADGGRTWSAPNQIDRRPEPWVSPWPGAQYTAAYPVMVRARDGYIHLFYSYARSAIKQVRMNRAWLDHALAR
jgi:predicted neuraminidase